MRRRVLGLLVVLVVAWGGLASLVGAGVTPELGLDLQGGASVVLTAPPETDPEVLDVAVEIMRRRIEDVGGVQEPEIAISGANTVLVQLPGVKDEQRALDAIGRTGQLTFRPVLAAYPGAVGPLGSAYAALPGTIAPETIVPETSPTTAGEPASATTVPPTTPPTTLAPATTTMTPPPVDVDPGTVDPETGITLVDDPEAAGYFVFERPSAVAGELASEVLLLGPARLRGADVAEAIPGFDTNRSQWVVSLDLTSDGGEAFAALTGEAAAAPVGAVQRQIAIVLDGDVVTAPEVNADVVPGVGITGGRAQITMGSGTDAETEAQDLGVTLRYGSLPVSFERSQVSKVSASLGSDSLRTGLLAGAIGLALVAVVLVLYYRVLGVVALVGLTVFGTLLVSIFAVLGATQGLTLTLAGVTGIIVSVGITADSYIVFFERIKDEIRQGVPVATAVTEGFAGAFRTILTADTVSLLAAGLLYALAVGPVKGFALSLGIATILDILIVRVFTRRAVWIVGHGRFGDGGAFSIAGAAGAES